MVRLRGFQKLTSVEQALQILFKSVEITRARMVSLPLQCSSNRVLAEDVIANEDLPKFDRSAVDGYAVRAEDTLGSTQFKPKTLKIIRKGEVAEGYAKQVWTGQAIPKGADAVVMLEGVKQIDNNLEVWAAIVPHENVSRKGEDIKKGEIALRSGLRLRSHHLGLLAALGRSEIMVFERPKVAVLATGNEIIDVGCKPKANQIFDVNRLVLLASCEELGVEPLDLGIAKDDLEEIIAGLRRGLNCSDAVITTGGSSVGFSDLVPDAVNKIGKQGVVVHGVALRPAMPTALAVVDGKPVLILSGNPVAAIVGFEMFARPLISKMLGLRSEEKRPVIRATMTKRVTTSLGRLNFVRVKVWQIRDEYFAKPVSSRGSGLISTMTCANGFVLVPENREGIVEDEVVSVSLFDNVEAKKNDV